MAIRFVAAGLLLVSLAGSILAAEPKGVSLMGASGESDYLEWSVTKSQTEARLGDFVVCGDGAVQSCVISKTQWQPNFGQSTFTEHFRLSADYLVDESHPDGAFFSYTIEFNADIYDWVLDAIGRALGPPEASESGKVENRLGAVFDQKTASWTLQTTGVKILKRRSEKLTEGLLQITYLPLATQVPPPKRGRAPF